MTTTPQALNARRDAMMRAGRKVSRMVSALDALCISDESFDELGFEIGWESDDDLDLIAADNEQALRGHRREIAKLQKLAAKLAAAAAELAEAAQ